MHLFTYLSHPRGMASGALRSRVLHLLALCWPHPPRGPFWDDSQLVQASIICRIRNPHGKGYFFLKLCHQKFQNGVLTWGMCPGLSRGQGVGSQPGARVHLRESVEDLEQGRSGSPSWK